MFRKKMCEINGKRYVTPGVFADGCGWSSQKVTAACIDGRIVGACKDSSGKWIIPIDATKPLELEQIRELMISTIYLKNKPETRMDYYNHDDIVSVYSYLQQTGYIEPFNQDSERIPYEVVLTDKGLNIATEGTAINIKWLKIGSEIIQVAASILTIVQVAV